MIKCKNCKYLVKEDVMGVYESWNCFNRRRDPDYPFYPIACGIDYECELGEELE